MPTKSKRTPPMDYREGAASKAKAPEGAVEEERELEEEGEEEDMDCSSCSPSKRSSKKSKLTKDGECSGCKNSKKKCAKCAATMKDNCGSYPMKRNDALTTEEYNAACALGIRDRSRTYIRARLDAAERLDLKCGNGAISEGEKCHVGPAQKVDPRAAAKAEYKKIVNNPSESYKFGKQKANTKGVGNKIRRVGEFAARVGGGLVAYKGVMQLAGGAMSGNLGEASRGYRNLSLGSAALQVAAASKASRMGKKELSNEFLKGAGRNVAIGVGQEAAIGAVAGFSRTGGLNNLRRRTSAAYQQTRIRTSGVRPMRRDSTYATGFSTDYTQLAI